LVFLYKQVFGTDYTLDFIKAKYGSDYTGITAQGHFAFFEKKPVAFHGAIPVIMTQGGQKELCAQYGDAMTLKSHAGNGLFTILGQKTDELLQTLGVRFAWGFPNQNSEYGYVNKLNWLGTERMQAYILKINNLSTEQLLRKSKIFSKLGQSRIEKKLENLIIPKTNIHSINVIKVGGIDRSNSFYKYRSFTSNYFINLNGTQIWIKPQGGLLVGDLEVKSEEQVLKTVDELKQFAKELGLHQVVIQASPKSKLNQILKSKYDVIDSWLIGYKSFNSEFELEKLQFTYGDLDTF
jgi:hypothetical protein